MAIMESMDYTEVPNSPTGTFSSFKYRTSNTWQWSKRSASWAWANTHILAKAAVALLLFTTLVLVIAIATIDVTRSSGHGLPCSSSSECDSGANLECKNSRCECIKPKLGKAAYDPSYFYKGWFSTTWGRCAVQYGGYCNDSENYPCDTDFECASFNNQCRCRLNLYFNKELETCEPQGRYGAYCKPEEYNFCRFGLNCEEMRCSCGSERTYDHEKEACVGKAGKSCSHWIWKCVSAAVCRQNTCECPVGLQASSDGRDCIPFLKPGENCSKSLRCGEDDLSGLQLSCLNGKCTCDPATSALEHGSCLPKAGQPCLHGECFSDSFCDKPLRASSSKSETTRFTCKCKDGKTRDGKTGLCVTKHKGLCAEDADCGYLMACKNSVCRCAFGFLVFDANKNQCLKKVDANCDSDSENECAGRAVCLRSKCSCTPPNEENSEGLCVSSEGQDCKRNEDCHKEALLMCSEGVSICMFF